MSVKTLPKDFLFVYVGAPSVGIVHKDSCMRTKTNSMLLIFASIFFSFLWASVKYWIMLESSAYCLKLFCWIKLDQNVKMWRCEEKNEWKSAKQFVFKLPRNGTWFMCKYQRIAVWIHFFVTRRCSHLTFYKYPNSFVYCLFRVERKLSFPFFSSVYFSPSNKNEVSWDIQIIAKIANTHMINEKQKNHGI